MKIEKIFNKKKGVHEYQARFQLGNKEFRPRAASRKTLLETIDEIRARSHRTKFELPVLKDSPKLKTLFSKYLTSAGTLKSKALAKNAFETMEKLLGADFELTDLRTAHLQAYLDFRLGQSKIQPQTANREMTAIAAALHKADNYFPEIAGWTTPRIPRAKVTAGRRERIITEKEIETLLGYLARPKESKESEKNFFHRVRLAHFFEFGLLTGLRRKEISTLKFSDYDRKTNSLRVVRWKTSTVTNFSPMPKKSVQIIDARRELQVGEFIFTPDGKPVHSDHRTLKKVCKDLNLDYGQTASGFTLHDLRHVFITNLVTKGVDIETVKGFSGHTDTKTLLRYTHSSNENRRRAIALIDGTHLLDELTDVFHKIKSGEMPLDEFLKKMSEIR